MSVCLLPLWARDSKLCLLGRYLYLFPMRRRLQFGASPFPGCDWLFPLEWGDTVWPTLLSSSGTYLHSPNTHSESVTKALPMHYSLTKPQPEYLWQCCEHIKSKHDGRRLNCHACIHLSINSWVCVRCCTTHRCTENTYLSEYVWDVCVVVCISLRFENIVISGFGWNFVISLCFTHCCCFQRS